MVFVAWSVINLTLALLYSGVISYFLWQWRRLPSYAAPVPGSGDLPTISVVVAARNEAAVLESTLQALMGQNYPLAKFEVLLIDDCSTDATLAIAQTWANERLRVWSLAEGEDLAPGLQFKKKAIQTGVTLARGELIVTTDADCRPPTDWLYHLGAFYAEFRPPFIAAPVVFDAGPTRLERFQALDFLGMMVLTGAGLHSNTMLLCNGANLAYPRTVFWEVGGYAGIEQLASGDDVFLLQKIAQRYPGQPRFLKALAAAVVTPPQHDWSGFIQQRLRWGTKNAAYRSKGITLVLAVVFFHCWGILLTLGWWVAAPSWSRFALLSGLVALKASADFALLRRAALFFERRELLRHFWSAQWLHTLYIALIGLLANLVKSYTWKNRRLR